jgi:hypothetical protein
MEKAVLVYQEKSAVSWWLFGPILITIIVSAYLKAADDLKTLWISLSVLAFVGSFLLNTSYRIYSDGTLKVVSGLIPFPKIKLQEITAVVYTSNPISSPALSLKRMALYKGKSIQIIISPKNRESFVSEMKKFNGALSVVLK